MQLLLLFWLIPPICTDTSILLTRHLLDNHHPGSPPEGLVIVDFHTKLNHIVSLDERKQRIQLFLYFKETWRDETLSWEPDDFGGINSTWLPSISIWIPDIIVFNMLEHIDVLSAVRSTVHVTHDGLVTFSYPRIVTLMCGMHIADFPFDHQTCAMHIASWGYGDDKVQLRPVGRNESLTHYERHEEWAVKNLQFTTSQFSHEDNVVSEMQLVVHLQRKPFYFIFSLLIPTYIICALSVGGLFSRFSTRDERQERFTLGVTATLTLAVLSLVVTEKVPHMSDEIPLLVLYFHMNTVVITVATILTGGSMMISNWEEWNPRKRSTEPVRNWKEIADKADKILMVVFTIIVTVPFVYMCNRCTRLTEESFRLYR